MTQPVAVFKRRGHPRLSTVEQAASPSPVKLTVEVIGGLPVGSAPENPAGTEYDEVPPEEFHG